MSQFTQSGLRITENIIDSGQAGKLLEQIDNWMLGDNANHLLRTRTTVHYGHFFSPQTLSTDLDRAVEQVPSDLRKLLDHLFVDIGLGDWDYDQITINSYPPGGGIGAHVDTHSCFDENIVIISIGSDIAMEFSNTTEELGIERTNVWLPNGSLLWMSGAARYRWKHKIACRKTDTDPDGHIVRRDYRVSVTVRKIRDPKICKCPYQELCDTQTPSSFVLPDRLKDN